LPVVGIADASKRRTLVMHTRTPPDNPASPRYAAVGIAAIAMLTGEPRGQTESDQASS